MVAPPICKEPPDTRVLDEEVTLVPHDPAWAPTFAAEQVRLASTLELTSDALEHIGSTAVPDLDAKPVIDIMLGIPRLPPDGNQLSRLEILGYQNLGEAGVPGRLYLRLRGDQHFNLHVVQRGGTHWTSNLALRDLLRRDAAARERYAAGKREALANAGPRLLAYSAAKQRVLHELLGKPVKDP
jgi:GrpB-like predicted nucleotidyltransferase (UPF0157 family)